VLAVEQLLPTFFALQVAVVEHSSAVAVAVQVVFYS
jgi:hypothetical protein